MRYIKAEDPRKISPFDKMGLLDLIVKTGIAETINAMPAGVKSDKNAVAETIENNVRRKIMKASLSDPRFYESMSALLDEVIKFRKERANNYEAYLQRIAELAKLVNAGQSAATPAELDTPGTRALWNNMGQDTALALAIDATVKKVRHDDWRGVQAREQVIKAALYDLLQEEDEVERVFVIVHAQEEY